MTTSINITDLKSLWAKVLGQPVPSEQQFIIWMESHPSDVVRYGILRAATKNQMMGGSMSQDHKIRFASKVMLTLSALRQENAANREKLRQEFEGQVQQ
jgi:hypothetical protein